MVSIVPRPAVDEYAPSYADYVASVPEHADVIDVLRTQLEELPRLLGGVAESNAGFRYAPGKWSVKEVVGHLADAERVFAYRLLRIGRGDATPLAGFEEDDYVRAAAFDRWPLAERAADWLAVRHSTLSLVQGFDAPAWLRRGIANGKPISARAIIHVVAGHTRHHADILRSRYGL